MSHPQHIATPLLPARRDRYSLSLRVHGGPWKLSGVIPENAEQAMECMVFLRSAFTGVEVKLKRVVTCCMSFWATSSIMQLSESWLF